MEIREVFSSELNHHSLIPGFLGENDNNWFMCIKGGPLPDDSEGGFENVLENVRTIAKTFLAVAEAGKAEWCMDERQPAKSQEAQHSACLLMTFKPTSSRKATSQTLQIMLASGVNFSKSFPWKDFKWKYKLHVSNKGKKCKSLLHLALTFPAVFYAKEKHIRNDSKAQTLTSLDPAPSNQDTVDWQSGNKLFFEGTVEQVYSKWLIWSNLPAISTVFNSGRFIYVCLTFWFCPATAHWLIPQDSIFSNIATFFIIKL